MNRRNFLKKVGTGVATAAAVVVAPAVLMLASPPVHAVIDITGATTGITDGTTAVVSVITALVVAYGAFIGLRMALRAIKRAS